MILYVKEGQETKYYSTNDEFNKRIGFSTVLTPVVKVTLYKIQIFITPFQTKMIDINGDEIKDEFKAKITFQSKAKDVNAVNIFFFFKYKLKVFLIQIHFSKKFVKGCGKDTGRQFC